MTDIDNFQRLNLEGPYLLAQLAEDAEGPLAATFDALAYNLVFDYAMTRCGDLRKRARAHTAENLPVYDVPDDLLDEVAHETAWRTCANVRESAAKFDPALGSAGSWVVGRAALMYLDIARKLHKQTERFGELSDPLDLVGLLDADERPDESAQRLLDAEAYEEAAACLSDRERAVFFGVVIFDLRKRDIAIQLYGTADKEKAVDGVLQRAKKKMQAAWADRRPLTPSHPSATNVPPENADEEAV